MPVHTNTVELTTKGFCDIHDLTDEVVSALNTSRLKNGTITAFVPGSTAGITTIEYESGAINDFKKTVERLIPQDIYYDHNTRWGDGNGFSHIRAAMLGPSLSIPFINGRIQLGTWQQIILVDFDNRPRQRNVIIQIVGEGE